MYKNKRPKSGLIKHILLVGIISIIVFVGSLVGLKTINDGNFDYFVDVIVNNFVSLFSLFSFLLISIWILTGTIISILNLIKIFKTKFVIRSIIFVIFSLAFLGLGAISITFYSLLLRDFFQYAWSLKFDEKWFETMIEWYNQYLLNAPDNKYYIITFVFATCWSLLGIIYLVFYKMLVNGEIKNKKEIENVNEVNEPELENIIEEQINENNETIAKKDNNEKEVIEEKVQEEIDDWGASSITNYSSEQEKTKNGTSIEEIKSKDDPYSIFD